MPDEDPDNDGHRLTLNLRFPGQYFDDETGMHYNWHRYYRPETGHYLNADSLGINAALNLYTYAYNSPYMFTDKDGMKVTLYERAISDEGIIAEIGGHMFLNS